MQLSAAIPIPLVDLLIVDPSAASYAPVLRGSYRITATSSADIALEQLLRVAPAAIVAELDLPEGRALEVCERARTLPSQPVLVVTTDDPDRVPAALVAGCDSVLLKPFAPNLMFARLGRMLRARATELRARSDHPRATSGHLTERSQMLPAGACKTWPNSHCPYCTHEGVASFVYASHRRAWYACLECRKVWMAKRCD
jgi:DNA-binding response OmpR family regulator